MRNDTAMARPHSQRPDPAGLPSVTEPAAGRRKTPRTDVVPLPVASSRPGLTKRSSLIRRPRVLPRYRALP